MDVPGSTPPGNLDPSAQEFWPAAYPPSSLLPLIPFLPPPAPQLFYYAPPPPPPTPPPQLFQPPPPPSLPPTRALLLTSVPGDASESALRRDLEVFGDVRAVQMGRVREGIVTVHFYDLRAAHAAVDEIRDQHIHHQHRLRLFYSPVAGVPPPPPPGTRGLVCGRAVWAQFVAPAVDAFPDGPNQGTLVVFNLDSRVSASDLAHIFGAFGPIRELRETPMKKHQRFVEFFDVRNAAAALAGMNGKEISGKPVTIEFSRPGGGYGRRPIPNNHHQHQTRSMRHAPPSPPKLTQKWSPLRIIPRRTSPTNLPPRAYSQAGPSSKKPLESSSANSNGVEEATKDKGERNGEEGSSGPVVVITKPKTSSNGGEGKSRPSLKGKLKSVDPRFLINEDAMVDPGCMDSRTTVMIKNIPNKYSQKLLLNMLDNHCIHCNEQIATQGDANSSQQPLSSYDFLYLPIDFNNKCNVGYGFVNMTSPEAVMRLHKSFHQQHWEVFNSRKICQITYARVQGLEALKEHFKNSKFACETEEYLPVAFSPPRDGRAHLSDPLPIVPCCPRQNDDISATTASVPSSSPSLSSDGPCDDVGDGGVNNDDVVLEAGSADSASNDGEDYND